MSLPTTSPVTSDSTPRLLHVPLSVVPSTANAQSLPVGLPPASTVTVHVPAIARAPAASDGALRPRPVVPVAGVKSGLDDVAADVSKGLMVGCRLGVTTLIHCPV